MLELVAVEDGEYIPELGELRDLTADHFVRFDPANVYSVLQKKLIIKNNTLVLSLTYILNPLKLPYPTFFILFYFLPPPRFRYFWMFVCLYLQNSIILFLNDNFENLYIH